MNKVALTSIETLSPSQVTWHALNKILLSISSMHSVEDQVDACRTAEKLYNKMLGQRAEEARRAPTICTAIGD